MKVVAGIVGVALITSVWVQSGSAQRGGDQVDPGDWPMINRDSAATRYSPLTQITTSNVTSLEEAWTFRLGGGATSVPLVVGGVMFVANGTSVVALDGDTGKQVWSYALQAVPPPPPASDAGRAAGPTPTPAAPPPGLVAAGGGRRGGGPPAPTVSARGVGYWPGDGSLGPRVLFMSGSRLIAVDADVDLAIEWLWHQRSIATLSSSARR